MLLSVALLLAPDGLAAQPRADSALHAALRRVPIGTPLRIRTIGRSTLEGKATRLTDSRVTLVDDQGAEWWADLDRVESVWVPHHRAARGGAVGAAIGVLPVGVSAGMLASGLCDCEDPNAQFIEGFATGAAIGAAAGALMGMVIGSAVTGWEPYWVRGSGVRPRVFAAPGVRAPWRRAVQAGAGTRFSGPSQTVWVVTGTVERDPRMGMRPGFELGYVHQPIRRQARQSVINTGAGTDTITQHFTSGGRTLHASVLLRLAIDARGDGYWIADVGAARHSVMRRFSSSNFPGVFANDEIQVWPLFGIGVGTRFGRWSADVRLRGPMSFEGSAHTLMAFTAGYRP